MLYRDILCPSVTPNTTCVCRSKYVLILFKIPFLELIFLFVVPTASHTVFRTPFLSIHTLKSGETEIQFCRIFRKPMPGRVTNSEKH
jgi:hypothetical protein